MGKLTKREMEKRITLEHLREGPSLSLPPGGNAGLALDGLIMFKAPSRLNPFGAWELTQKGRQALTGEPG